MVAVEPAVETLISAAQCRAARGALGLSQGDLAELAGVARSVVITFERGASMPRSNNMDRLQAELEARGISFGTMPDGREYVAFVRKDDE